MQENNDIENCMFPELARPTHIFISTYIHQVIQTHRNQKLNQIDFPLCCVHLLYLLPFADINTCSFVQLYNYCSIISKCSIDHKETKEKTKLSDRHSASLYSVIRPSKDSICHLIRGEKDWCTI